MKARELAEKLMEHPDFDVEFIFSEEFNKNDKWPTIRKFNNINISDIGHSDKIIILDGEEV